MKNHVFFVTLNRIWSTKTDIILVFVGVILVTLDTILVTLGHPGGHWERRREKDPPRMCKSHQKGCHLGVHFGDISDFGRFFSGLFCD